MRRNAYLRASGQKSVASATPISCNRKITLLLSEYIFAMFWRFL